MSIETPEVTVAKHTPEVTPAERAELLRRARDLAVEFDKVGREADETRTFPMAMVPLYKASGLAAAAVPKKFGGWGADILTTGLIGRELAKGDAGIALAFNMHQAMVGIFRGTPALEEPARERLMRSIADDQLLLCGPFSEARNGLAGLADTVAVPDPEGGWRISGQKNWSTMVEGADLISLNATITDADGKLPEDFREHANRESMFIIAADLPGISIDRTWDTLGMRATGSQTLVLDNVHVGPEAYAGNFRLGLIGEAEWAAVLFGGVYMGLADRAYTEARDILKKKHTGATAGAQDSAAKSQGYVQYLLGRMHYEIEVATRTYERTGELAIEGRFDNLPATARKAEFDVAKVATTEAAIAVTDYALRLVGGQAFRRGHIVERLFRDARAGVQHSFGTDQLYDFFGRYELGLLG
ncbi:acyl-CoA dehydrogenase family protein [soil metagenome]